MGSKVEKHLSRLAMPKTWKIDRKKVKWITRPAPGPHSFKTGLPINVLLRDILKYARTTKEVKRILNNKEVLVDGIIRKDYKFIIGLMDVLSIPKLKKQFRILFDKKGKITAFAIGKEEANLKPCKIINKTIIRKKKMQLNLFDGKNILSNDKPGKVGDSVVIEMPSQKIKATLNFEKGAIVYLIGGKHIGETGIVEEIKRTRVIYKRGKELFETNKECTFVIGKDKPIIKLPE